MVVAVGERKSGEEGERVRVRGVGGDLRYEPVMFRLLYAPRTSPNPLTALLRLPEPPDNRIPNPISSLAIATASDGKHWGCRMMGEGRAVAALGTVYPNSGDLQPNEGFSRKKINKRLLLISDLFVSTLQATLPLHLRSGRC